MKRDAEEKLDKIADIWNEFIWDFKYCNSRVKFTHDVQSNYFGDILGYFKDTFDVVNQKNNSSYFTDQFSYHISLLQAIYIHQDFIEELLIIFRTNIRKGELKLDDNYSINRDIRNELIGHPIRKITIPDTENDVENCDKCGSIINSGKQRSVLLSSTTFGYRTNGKELVYLRYHRKNNYEYEKMSFDVGEIIKRHDIFLNKYFDIIIVKLKSILMTFTDKLKRFELTIENLDFNSLIRVASLYYETIFSSSEVYEKIRLQEIYNKRHEHRRYQFVIDRFRADILNGLIQTQARIYDLFNKKEKIKFEKPPIPYKITFMSAEKRALKNSTYIKPKKIDYHYELGKLETKRNPVDFSFFADSLRAKCEEMPIIQTEIDHMELNINNKLEYYSSLTLIRHILLK